MRVGVLVFPGVEELDFVGPWEVLSYANKLQPGALEMMLVGTETPVMAFNRLRVIPDVTLEQCPELDILVVPGGKGRLQAMHDQRVLQFIQKQAAGLRYLTSVCTGAFLLAEAGLLRGRQATTHFSAIEELKSYPEIEVVTARVVQTDHVICAAGVSSGIDMSLYLLSQLFGEQAAEDVARNIEYKHLGGAKSQTC